MKTYQPIQIDAYPGRSSDEHLYLREVISFNSIEEIEPVSEKSIALLGYCCDEGVRRNQGRVGAKDGPNAIRKQFGKLANHSNCAIYDFGNLICDGDDLEGIQQKLGESVGQLVSKNYLPVVLGGGHDIAYGHFMGLQHTFPEKKIGIINFDSHLDLRKPNPKGNSGTPFYQISQEVGREHFFYLPIGIRKESNHKGLFATAQELGVNIIPLEACIAQHFSILQRELIEFSQQVDLLYITIDLDGFSSAYAPGVSAPHPVGLRPEIVMACLNVLFQTGKVVSLDLAEMNPTYDQDGLTAKLAASLLYQISCK